MPICRRDGASYYDGDGYCPCCMAVAEDKLSDALEELATLRAERDELRERCERLCKINGESVEAACELEKERNWLQDEVTQLLSESYHVTVTTCSGAEVEEVARLQERCRVMATEIALCDDEMVSLSIKWGAQVEAALAAESAALEEVARMRERHRKVLDELRERCRSAAQCLIEEIGASGPENADKTAARASVVIAELRERCEALEVELSRMSSRYREEIDRINLEKDSQWVRRCEVTAAHIKAEQAINAESAALEEVAELRESLVGETPWPLLSILETLAAATKSLLDGHGYGTRRSESYRHAMTAALDLARRVWKLPPNSADCGGECHADCEPENACGNGEEV